MKLTAAPPPGEFTGHTLRALTARFAHPQHSRAAWEAEFADWRRAIQEFKQFEESQIDTPAGASAHGLRQHRYLLFLLRSRGEELALALAEAPGFPAHEIEALTGQVDAFLDDLWMSWADWHAEPNPVHREMLAGFLS